MILPLDPDKIGELNTATQLHVTTIGRRTGKPHRVQIAFIYREKRFIMASERGWKADWLQNIAVDPIVALEVAGLKLKGKATILGGIESFLDLVRPIYMKYFGEANDLKIKERSKDSVLVSIEILE